MCRKSLTLFLTLLIAGCATRASTPDPSIKQEAPVAGWHPVGAHQCYFSPDFASLQSADLRQARGDALFEVTRRWRGQVDETFSLPEDLTDGLENILLGDPQQIEAIVALDNQLCVRWSKGEILIPEYARQLQEMLNELKAGTCRRPAFELITQYIEVDHRWQAETPLCKGDRIRITASQGLYTIQDQGDTGQTVWITAQGDRSRPAEGSGLPCQSADCYYGQLLGRFVDQQGKEVLFPIGQETSFVAPAHGKLFFGINDVELYDNRFMVKDGARDFLSVEIRPAD